MYGTSTVSTLFQKEFLNSKPANRNEIQLVKFKTKNEYKGKRNKTENGKETETEKNKGNAYQPEPTEPAQLPISPVLVPVCLMTSGTHQRNRHLQPLDRGKLLAVDLPPADCVKMRATTFLRPIRGPRRRDKP
jgi:hypothetical protein